MVFFILWRKQMIGMDMAVWLKAILEIGVTPALLLAFILYFFDRDRRRDKQLDDMNASFKERENLMIAESARREEIMRTEAEKREKIMRQEAEKRECTLMRTIEGFSRTMEKISDAMGEMKNAFTQMECKIESIESKIQNKTGGSHG